MTTTPKRTAKKGDSLSNEQIAALAREYKGLDLKVKKLTEEKDKIKPRILAAMVAAKTRLIEVAGVRVVYSQQQYTDYDEAALWSNMTPRQRRACFDQNFNINELPSEERAELLRALRDMLTPSQRRRCTTNVLNEDKMSAAVQAGIVPLETVKKHSEVKYKAAYPTITLEG